jgi:hypothetical protein
MLRAMRVRASLIGSAFGLGMMLLGGCAYGEVRQVVRAQFASDFDCPEVQLKKRELWYSYEGPDQFKAIGCGKVRTYTCPADAGRVSYDEPVCTFVDGDADAPKTVKMSDDLGDTGDGSTPPPSEDSSSGGDTGNDEPTPSSDDSGDSSSSSSGDSDDGLGGDSDLGGESSTPAPAAHGAASGGVKAGGGGVKASGGIHLGGGTKKK